MSGLVECGLDIRGFYLAVWRSLPLLLRELLRLRRTIADLRPCLVHAQYGTMTAAVCAVVSFCPLMITFRGPDLNRHPSVPPLRQAMGHLLSQLAALRSRQVICVSNSLRSRLWWRRTRAAVLPSPVDMTLFAPTPRTEARSRLGWDLNDCVVLLSVSRDPVNKGLPISRAAIARVQWVIPQVRLVVLADEVDPGRMPLYYNAADCLLLASASEGSPNVVKEAMACNCPVIATAVGDVAERLAGVEPSYVVERSERVIAQALLDLLRNPRRSNGRAAIAALSLEAMLRQYVELYAAVLQRPPGDDRLLQLTPR